MTARQALQLSDVLACYAAGIAVEARHRTSVNDRWFRVRRDHAWNPARYHYREAKLSHQK